MLDELQKKSLDMMVKQFGKTSSSIHHYMLLYILSSVKNEEVLCQIMKDVLDGVHNLDQHEIFFQRRLHECKESVKKSQ